MAENIRETFLLNFKNRKLEQKQLVNDWINAQDNVTASVLSLIQHSVDRFGFVDVLDHEISKRLFAETLMYKGDIKVESENKEVQKNEQTKLDKKDISSEETKAFFTEGFDKSNY